MGYNSGSKAPLEPHIHERRRAMFKRTVKGVIISALGLLLGLILGVQQVQALGTPQIIKIDPSSPSPVGTCVTIRARVNWDGDFRSMRIRFGNEGWQESAEIEFERNFCTKDWSPGWYTIRVEVARWGDNNWSSPTVAEASYELTSAPQPTSPPQPTAVSYGPSISQVNFNPSGGTQVGNNVGIHIKVDSSNPGAISITPSCGNTAHAEHTVPEFDTTWYTSGCGAGTRSVKVCARHVNDPDWAYATCTERSYTLTAPPAPIPAPSASFWSDAGSIMQGQCTWLRWETSGADKVDIDGTVVQKSGSMKVCPAITKRYSLKAVSQGGEATRSLTIDVSVVPSTSVPDYGTYFSTGDIIQIGYDVFVIVDGQRRLVPNPETLDALGITRSWIDNEGLTREQLRSISQGPDIPDVNKDRAGFDAFKSRYFPNTAPIVPATPMQVAPTAVPTTSSGGPGVVPTPTQVLPPTSPPSDGQAPQQPTPGVEVAGARICRVQPVEITADWLAFTWKPVQILGITVKIPVPDPRLQIYLDVPYYDPEPAKWFYANMRVSNGVAPNCDGVVVCQEGRDERGLWQYGFWTRRVLMYPFWPYPRFWRVEFAPPEGQSCP